MIKTLLLIWLVGIHAFAFLAMWDSDLPYRIDRKLDLGIFTPHEITFFYSDMLGSQLQLDGNVEEGSVIFLGDSLTQGLNVAAVTNNAINYGIGMDTSLGLLKRVPQYQSLNRASIIVIAIGVNDLLRARRDPADILSNYQQILDSLPQGKTVIMQAVFPTDETTTGLTDFNEKIIRLNAMLQSLAKERGHEFLSLQDQLVGAQGNLKQKLHAGDGLHLSSEGYKLWIQALSRVIAAHSN